MSHEIYNYIIGSINKYNIENNINDNINIGYKTSKTFFYITLLSSMVLLILVGFISNQKIIRILHIILIFITIIALIIYLIFLVFKNRIYSYSYNIDNNSNDNKTCDKITIEQPPDIDNYNVILGIFTIVYIVLLVLYSIFTNQSIKYFSYIYHEKVKKNMLEKLFDLDKTTHYHDDSMKNKNTPLFAFICSGKYISSFYTVFKWGINIILFLAFPIIYILHIIVLRVILYFYARNLYYKNMDDSDKRKMLALIFDKNVFFFNLTQKIKSKEKPYDKENELTDVNKTRLKTETNVFSKLPYGIPWYSLISILEKIYLHLTINTKKDRTIKDEKIKPTKEYDIFDYTNINNNNKKISDFGKDSHIFSFPASMFVTE